MAKRRIQANTGLPTPALQPVASPTNSFEHTTSGQQLDQLARGLATLSPAVARYSDTLAEQKANNDFAEGQRKAKELADSAKEFKDAIRKGQITPDKSPWFMAGLREQFGRLAADRMNQALVVAVANDEQLQSTTNVADYDAFASKFLGDWQDQNVDPKDRDGQFDKGFGSKAEAYIADSGRQFASQLAGRVVKHAGNAHFSEVMNEVINERGRHVTNETIGASISALNDAAIARGVGGQLVNDMTVEAITAAAKRMNDPTILEIADHVMSGPAGKGGRTSLSTTRTGSAAIEEAENQIASENQARINREYQATQQERDKNVDTILGAAVTALEGTDNPHAVDLKTFREQMTKVSPEKVNLLYQLQDAWSDRTLVDDPLQVASAFRRIYTPNAGESYTTMEEAAAMVANRQMGKDSYRAIVNEMQQREANGGKSPFEHDPLFKGAQRQVRAMFTSEFGFEGPQKRQLAEEAVDEFSMRYIRWRSGPGKDASEAEARTFIHDTRLEVFRAKSGVSEVRDLDKLPEANLGPTTPDPNKRLITDPSNIHMLEDELDQIEGHKKNGFSAQALDVLAYAGLLTLPPDLKAIRALIKVQKGFIPGFIPDSTEDTN
jgi:uncharacterized protein YcbK (DUF882 family)